LPGRARPVSIDVPKDDFPVDEESYAFGSFRLAPAQRELLEDGKPLRLGSRAFDILVTLVESAGETIGRDQLIARAWPDTVVDEGALRVHVAALRKALGDGRGGNRFIANIPGRGYSFVAPVRREQLHSAPATADGGLPTGNLPVLLTRIVGRDDIIAALAARLVQRRLLTIVGPGGIGKTTVAVAVAEAMTSAYPDGVWFVGLASLPDPDLVPSAVSTVLGISVSGVDPVLGLTAWLRDKQALIVLDSCEHIIGAAAAIAEAILKAAPQVHILATSREQLRAEGEWLHRLASLAVPPQTIPQTPDGAIRYSAVELFNERATATADGFVFEDADVPAVLEICHRLDGVPLALELAAAQVSAFGVKGVAARLDDRFAVLTMGRRTALPRHQTLRAAMDWSYDLLPEIEQVILCRLSIFRGAFNIKAATAVATDERTSSTDVLEGVANLAAKSLITTDISSEVTHHRLLDTPRAYALEKLGESGEAQSVALRHAKYCLDIFQRAEIEWETRPTSEWLADYEHWIDDVRAALDWTFSPRGNASIGVALTAASVTLWMHLSLLEESRAHAERALSAISRGSSGDARYEMQLQSALAASLMSTAGVVPKVGAAWTTALDIAESLDDVEYHLRALSSLFWFRFAVGEFRPALGLAERFCALAATRGEPADQFIGDRMLGAAQHHLGDQSSARRHIERMLASYVAPASRSHVVRFQRDQRLAARCLLARVLWLQGFPNQAILTAQSAIEEALAADHALSLCSTLANAACPIALMVGDLSAAERHVAMLLDYSASRALHYWHAWGRSFNGALAVRRGDTRAGLELLRAAASDLAGGWTPVRLIPFEAVLAEALGHTGQADDGLATVDRALRRSECIEERVAIAELLRIEAELLLLRDGTEAAAAAEDHLRQALDWARRQGALSWELRIATSLARLCQGRHVGDSVRDLLGSVYGRFTEGFETADLRAAKTLLDDLA
jgi:predicted ATPase/DNA-binding winged helix-turn-helix (wHTH) protein